MPRRAERSASERGVPVARRTPDTRARSLPPVALALLALAVLGALALTAGCARRQPSTPTPAQVESSESSLGTEPASATEATEAPGASEETANAGAYSSATTSPNVSAPALDAFIAQQYPGYKVSKRVSVPNQIDSGRLSVNYLLVSTREPRFTLLVNVAELKPAETPDDAGLSHYLDLVGRVLTNDDVFSVNAAARYPQLARGGQNAIVDAYAAQKPSADAIAHDAMFDPEDGVDMGVEIGPDALDRAMQNFGDAGDYNAHATVAAGAQNSVVSVTLTPLPTQ